MSATQQEAVGVHFVGGAERRGAGDAFRAVDPQSAAPTGMAVHEADAALVDEAVQAAVDASDELARDNEARIHLLRGAANKLETAGDDIVATADRETALGEQRLQSELARTCFQLRLFADVVADGSYMEAIIDHADQNWVPGPRPDLRRMLVSRGPVAVFGASNFPLAFSVAGGDTASALAAGCPVIVKAHPAHPGTSELVGRALVEATAAVGLPAGAFGLLHAHSPQLARTLVTHRDVAAVGFTGSPAAGRALFDAAAARPEPIPVYAEMGSLNPVVVTPAALRERGSTIAESYTGSLLLGAGQFCTKPGVVLAPDDGDGRAFVDHAAERVRTAAPGPLLSKAVHDGLTERARRTTALGEVEVIAQSEAAPGLGHPALLLATAAPALARHADELLAEHFGPVGLVARYDDEDDLVRAVERLPGSLAVALHLGDAEASERTDLVQALQHRCGRLVFNGWPTGVAVTHAMHHGGPYPATTDAGHTSVGTTAVRRFLRPVCYQDAPAALLPPALRDDNPRGIWRLVDGHLTR